MKLKYLLFTFLFNTILCVNGQQIMTSPDVTINSTNLINQNMRIATGIIEGGKDITASGILRIPIVFVKFADDNNSTNNWPNANQMPSWASTFVNSQIPTNNIYSNNNFSKFYDLSSGGNGNGTLGEFQVIGDVYFISLNKNKSFFTSDGEVSRKVIDTLDNPNGVFKVDFRKYDNWKFKVSGTSYMHEYIPFNPTTSVSADSILDFMLIYWKDKSISLASNVGGAADLPPINVPMI